MAGVTMQRRFFHRIFAAFVSSWLFLLSPSAFGVVLTVTPATYSATLQPGEIFTVTGFVTNLTGADLFATDIFFNFSGFPADKLAINQVLGATDFVLADRTESDEIDLFTIALLTSALPGETYSFEFFALDINGVFSDVSQFAVTTGDVAPPIGVPEPASAAMFMLGLLLLSLRRTGNRVRSRE